MGVAVFLRRGVWPALALVVVGGMVHPTTALWFAVMLGVAGLASGCERRPPLVALAATAALAGAWTVLAGPMAGRLAPMDEPWLAVLGDRAYLFADRWPASVWLTHALVATIIAAAAIVRRRSGRLTPREAGLMAGAAALVAVFLLLLPLVASRVALAIQLQPARVFWLLDFVAVVSLIWLVEALADRGWPRVPVALAAVLVLFSAVRGAYVMTVEFPDRSLVRPQGAPSAWRDAMRWAESHTPPDAHWLAHPDHAFRYGTSLRVAGKRDVFHEQSKDPSVAMYDRQVAMRVRERGAAIADFDVMRAQDFSDLARRYDLDFLVTEQRLSLPVAYQNSQFYVYRFVQESP
jgi:hypothetical protein